MARELEKSARSHDLVLAGEAIANADPDIVLRRFPFGTRSLTAWWPEGGHFRDILPGLCLADAPEQGEVPSTVRDLVKGADGQGRVIIPNSLSDRLSPEVDAALAQTLDTLRRKLLAMGWSASRVDLLLQGFATETKWSVPPGAEALNRVVQIGSYLKMLSSILSVAKQRGVGVVVTFDKDHNDRYTALAQAVDVDGIRAAVAARDMEFFERRVSAYALDARERLERFPATAGHDLPSQLQALCENSSPTRMARFFGHEEEVGHYLTGAARLELRSPINGVAATHCPRGGEYAELEGELLGRLSAALDAVWRGEIDEALLERMEESGETRFEPQWMRTFLERFKEGGPDARKTQKLRKLVAEAAATGEKIVYVCDGE